MRRPFLGISALTAFIIACGGMRFIAPPTPTVVPTGTASPPPTETASPTLTISPTPFPTQTATLPPSETPPPTDTLAPSLTTEPQWIVQGPGEIVVPILLYHHIGFSLKEDNIYYVSPEAFDQQMNLLYQWGYKTILVELLSRGIQAGGELPPRPILLTFGEGSETAYTTALPIMQRYGFTGASYIVYNYIGIAHHMNADQIRALHTAGWEIGSHSLSHTELTTRPERQEGEIVQSRRRLEALLGVPVQSFAYPFGAYDDDSLHYVHFAGYIAALGLGKESIQGPKNLFYLYRYAVRGDEDLEAFAGRLPWQEDQYELVLVTIFP